MIAFPMPGASRLTLLKVDPGINTSILTSKREEIEYCY
jgi:hypothetical protein